VSLEKDLGIMEEPLRDTHRQRRGRKIDRSIRAIGTDRSTVSGESPDSTKNI
jgi:hypothetical protein